MKFIYFSFMIIMLTNRAAQGMDQQPEPKKNNGQYLLHQAAEKGLLGLVKNLVINYKTTDLAQTNDDNLTALQVAQNHNQTDIVVFLTLWQNISSEQKNAIRQQITPHQEKPLDENQSHLYFCAICKKACTQQMQLPCCKAYVHQNCFIENRITIRDLKQWPCANQNCSEITDFDNSSNNP